MFESLLLIQILQFVLSSFLVFGFMALLIEACLYFCKIKDSRIRAFFRYIPILKLPLDLLLYIFSACAHFTNYNPLSCQSYLENMIVRFFHLDIEVSGSIYTTHPLADYLTREISSWGLETAAACFGLIFFGMIVHKLYIVISSTHRLKKLCLASEPCTRSVTSVILKTYLLEKNIQLRMTDLVPVPTAALKNYILIPKKQLKDLSQDEFEAIIAHELEHLRWYDPLLKFTSSLIGSFFWWLPTKRWIKKIEAEQEYASDSKIHRYGFEHFTLAEAIVKISKSSQKIQHTKGPFCYLTHARPFTLKRLEKLLDKPTKQPMKSYMKRTIIAGVIGFMLLVIFRVC